MDDTGWEVLQSVIFYLEKILQIFSALLYFTFSSLLNLLSLIDFVRVILKCTSSSGIGIFVSIDDGDKVGVIVVIYCESFIMIVTATHDIVSRTKLLISQVSWGQLGWRGRIMRALHLVCQKLNLIVGSFQLELKPLNRSLLILDDFQARILVDDGQVTDILRSTCIVQGWHVLIQVVI